MFDNNVRLMNPLVKLKALKTKILGKENQTLIKGINLMRKHFTGRKICYFTNSLVPHLLRTHAIHTHKN